MNKRTVELSPEVIHRIWTYWTSEDVSEDQILLRVLPINPLFVQGHLPQKLHLPAAEAEGKEQTASNISTGEFSAGKIPWVDDVRAALKQLGGEGDLSEIYGEVRRLRCARGLPIKKSFKATIRQIIQSFSSNSNKLRLGKDEDYFEHVSSGRWRLRKRL